MSNTVTSEHTRRRNEVWSNNRKGPIDICKQTLMSPFYRKPKVTHANQHHHRVGETFPYTMIVLVCVGGLRFARKRAHKRLFTNVDWPFSIVAPEIYLSSNTPVKYFVLICQQCNGVYLTVQPNIPRV